MENKEVEQDPVVVCPILPGGIKIQKTFWRWLYPLKTERETHVAILGLWWG